MYTTVIMLTKTNETLHLPTAIKMFIDLNGTHPCIHSLAEFH